MRSTPRREYESPPTTTMATMIMVMKTGCLMEISAILMAGPLLISGRRDVR